MQNENFWGCVTCVRLLGAGVTMTQVVDLWLQSHGTDAYVLLGRTQQPHPAPNWKLHVPVINMREPMAAVWVEMRTFSLMAQVSPGPPEEIDSK